MSSRASSRRQTAEVAISSRPSRSKINIEAAEPEQGETEDEDGTEGDDDEQAAKTESDMTPEPTTSAPLSRTGSRRGAIRGRGRARGGKTSRAGRERTGTGTGEESEGGGKSLRLRKSVSYRELPAEVEEEEDDLDDMDDVDGDGDAEEVDGEGDEEAEPAQGSPGTPRRRARTSEQPLASPSTRELERVGAGRGGFSVKGAAAAAARARWAKYRLEKADDSDDGPRKPKARSSAAAALARRDRGAVADKLVEGTTIEIKGKEYTVGDDELVMDEDAKGETKIDADGALLGDREYRLVTFTSETRKNPKKVYALTIDAARACGYQDSLAFLRRAPQILKLACNATERQMLIDIGRVTGHLKNRMVTMVSMRNVYKIMGARIVKNGKWVQDDYYEEKAMAECLENGFTPNSVVQEEEILGHGSNPTAGGGRQSTNTRGGDHDIPRSVLSLAPAYTSGGPTTHFAGGGSDPWSEAGWGNKRQKLKSLGVTEEDWMWRTAMETRAIDGHLKEMREERLGRLEGEDARGWVWTMQKIAEGDDGDKAAEIEGGKAGEAKVEREMTAEWLKPPAMDRRRSGLSQEVILEDGEEVGQPQDEALQADADVEMPQADSSMEVTRKEGAIIVQTIADAARNTTKGWGAGSWEPGTARAIIEPHTHIPHIPLHTQPASCISSRLSYNPLISSLPDQSYTHHIQSSISGKAARGLASVEFVFEQINPEDGEEGKHERMMKMVRDAEDWERAMKRRKTVV